MTGPGRGWAEVAPPRSPVPGPPARWRPLAGPVLLLVAAALFGLTHHPRRALAAVVVGVVLAAVLLSSRRIRGFADRSVQRVTPVALAWLSWLVLAPVFHLVVTPLGVALRRVGDPPLDVSRDPARSSYWSVRATRRPSRPDRLFADERRWHALGFSRRQGRQIVVRTVAVVVVVEALLVGGFAIVERRRTSAPVAIGVSAATPGLPVALRGPDWAEEARAEQGLLLRGMVATPFTAASLRDFEGRYFNVANRVRASYRTPLVATRRPVEVWFFGGSTMLGLELQRDDHTIPSEVVRQAEAQGIAVTARNYGMASYVNFQETALLSLLVTAGERPDLVVFYDGVNDTGVALATGIVGAGPRGEPGELDATERRRALATEELHGASTDPPVPLGLRPEPKPFTVDTIIGDIVGVYGQGVDLGRTLADRYGFAIAHFWQPDMNTREPLDPAEKELYLAYGNTWSDRDEAMELSRRVRAALPAGVHDISDALDDLPGPVLSDTVHTNEKGARAVAEAMFGHLEPELRRLSAGG